MSVTALFSQMLHFLILESRWELPETLYPVNHGSSADLSEETCGSPLAKKKKVAHLEKLEEEVKVFFLL